MVCSRVHRWVQGTMVAAFILCFALVLAACTRSGSAPTTAHVPGWSAAHSTGSTTTTTTTTSVTTSSTRQSSDKPIPLPAPESLIPFTSPAPIGVGGWTAVGRRVDDTAAVYETTLVPSGSSQAVGIAWMDTHLLSAQLYSGSKSPGGGPYQFTAPIQPAQAATLVAAFNGGFMMNAAQGGYYTEGRTVVPLIAGAASLVIYANGSVTVGAWGADVSMASDVIAVRQNLIPLVANGQPTAQADSPDWQSWGATCGATSCSTAVAGIENQWRSGAGVTADGALVYSAGPDLTPLQLAQVLRARRGHAWHGARHQSQLAGLRHLRALDVQRRCDGVERKQSSAEQCADRRNLLRSGLAAGFHNHVGRQHGRGLGGHNRRGRPTPGPPCRPHVSCSLRSHTSKRQCSKS